MYKITDTQIDHILNDISARGVEMESLQQNLLDHICCIIEKDLEENGDFESFYQKTIKTFYKDALWEIEEETISLLTFKNYYTMKKIMIVSGIFSALTMTMGIILKFLHSPGASFGIVLGISSLSLIFLPLLFTLKAKEQQNKKDILITAIGTLSGILISLSILFKLMHWPLANILGMLSIGIMVLLFLPIYFFAGIRNPETKVNTIVSSVIIVMACCLFLTLLRTPKTVMSMHIKNTESFIRSQQILHTEQKQLARLVASDSLNKATIELSNRINTICEDLKTAVILNETGQRTIDADFANKNIVIESRSFGSNPFTDQPAELEKFNTLKKLIADYNLKAAAQTNSEFKQIPTRSSFIEASQPYDYGQLSPLGLLDQLTQIQMFVLQNERELFSSREIALKK